jgi:hypothetical protein
LAARIENVPDVTATRPNANTYWVVPYRFLAGEYPGDEDPVKAREKINRFLEVGVRHFVDLTEFGEYEFVPYETILAEESRAANITATYQRFPIRDISVPIDAAIWLRFSSRSIVR